MSDAVAVARVREYSPASGKCPLMKQHLKLAACRSQSEDGERHGHHESLVSSE